MQLKILGKNIANKAFSTVKEKMTRYKRKRKNKSATNKEAQYGKDRKINF